MDEDNAELPPILRSHRKLVEVILRIITKDVEGLLEVPSRRQQNRHVAHDGLERGLDFWRPPRRHAPLERFVKLALLEVFQPGRIVAELVPRGHVAHARGLVER